MITLGIDLGSNSCASAWMDTESPDVQLAVSIFPAGVDEQENKRGTPLGQARRQARSQRRNLARRSLRKRQLRQLLTRYGLLPADADELRTIFKPKAGTIEGERWDPWQLRRKGLREPLSPHEFGRVLVHLNQRRGAVGVHTDPDDPDEGKVKEGMDRLDKTLKSRGVTTVGELIARLMLENRKPITRQADSLCSRRTLQRRRQRADKGPVELLFQPVRNRQYRINEEDQLYAGRERIRDEFKRLWDNQRSFDSELSRILVAHPDLRTALDNEKQSDTWRNQGVLFGQRHTYWNTGTLGRCDLEPTEQHCPHADMHAQEFRVIETVNNIRVNGPNRVDDPLTDAERTEVIKALRSQKTGSVATVRKALGFHSKDVKHLYTLNLEKDSDREINTDWFFREVALGVFGEDRWASMCPDKRESVNRAILKFDPDQSEHEKRLRSGASKWWTLDSEQVEDLISAWKSRPKLEKRMKLSRSAIRNLLPYMRGENGAPMSVSEARRAFADDDGNGATAAQRNRYALGIAVLTKADRRFFRKHDEPIPPAPTLSNPVVRKAVHEVRRHVIAWWRKTGRTPDRIVIEYTRSATQPEKIRNEALSLNRKREAIRKKWIAELDLQTESLTFQRRAVDRVLLFTQQRGVCPLCEQSLGTPRTVANGTDVETDHIVPMSRSQDNGLNNKILVHRPCNKGKGNKTPKEFLTTLGFEVMERCLKHLDGKDARDEYFTSRDCNRKWNNLHLDAPRTDSFLASQFTDTAYATRQVGQWLRDVLFNGRNESGRGVYTTKGAYTAILRNDWGLSESELDRTSSFGHTVDEIPVPEAGGPANQSRRARKEKNKDRLDHIHHAIDAVCIAFAPDRLQDLAHFAQKQEIARADLGRWPDREALTPPPPWNDLINFRSAVINAARSLVISHRPTKRRLTGAFHKKEHYGPVIEPLPSHRKEPASTLFTKREPAHELKPAHLRVPKGWDELCSQLKDPNRTNQEGQIIRRQLAALPDPPPSKSGIVRDRALRDRLRKCLRDHGVDPDGFTAGQIKSLVQQGKLTMGSGISIKGVVLLRTHNDPVIIPRKKWNHVTNKMDPDSDPRTVRVYEGRNNHHIEIREDKRGRWDGKIIPTFDAAKRVRLEKKDAVDRSDNEDGCFVMSLAEGETIHMKHPRTGRPDHFVVFKLDKPKKTIHFIHHWDARPSSAKETIPAREDIALSPRQLQELGVEPGKPPVKVRVTPLGEAIPYLRD